jgi:cytoskeletal protein CcmA (bactofilin family)
LFNKEPLFTKRDSNVRPTERQANVTPDPSGALGRTPVPAQPYSKQPDAGLGAPPAPSVDVEDSAGSKLIVGPDIKLKGVEITDCDTLVVEGRVEASMDSRVVQIAEHGIFAGKATMDVAEIWGVFEGQLTVRKQLVIYGSGRVSGLIRYGKIRIEEGGELCGDIARITAGQTVPAASPAVVQPATGTPALAGSQAKTPAPEIPALSARQPVKSGAGIP